MIDVRCEYGSALTWVVKAANDARDQLERYVSQSMVQYVFWFVLGSGFRYSAAVTGSSTGYGRSMTELVLAKGDIAVATLRKPAMISDLAVQYGPERLLVLKLDVVKADEIISAFDAAVKAFGRVDVVFNNAGYAVVGEFEATSEQTARALFEVNFFGAANVTKEAVRVFPDVNRPQGGRLLQMSSMAVLTDAAAIAFYAATKCGERCIALAVDRY